MCWPPLTPRKDCDSASGVLTLAEIGLGDLVADESAYVEDCRVGIELHRLDQILLHDTDLQ